MSRAASVETSAREPAMQQFRVYAAVAIGTILLSAVPARAQAIRTFVSGHGSDSNDCSLGSPCRSFAAAVLVTSPGGEVTMLDPAGYGPVTITKAISIVNDGGGEAGINQAVSGQDAITINAGAGDVVNLQGLTLNGVGTGRHGIVFNTGGALNIQHCFVRGFTLDGVFAQASASAAFAISDTIVSNSNDGIVITALGGTVIAELERVAATGNQNEGIDLGTAGGTIQATIVDSVAAANGTAGFTAGGAAAKVKLIDSKAANNDIGLRVITGATMDISETTVSGNVTNGFLINSAGLLQTFGDNYIIDTNNSGTLTPIGEQ
jgi:hypothetical protein